MALRQDRGQALRRATPGEDTFSPIVFISQPVRHSLDQLDLVVESLRHAVGVTVSNVTHDGLEPTRQRPSDALKRFLSTLVGSLYEFQERLTSWFVIFTIEPFSYILDPGKRLAQRGKTSLPVVTRDDLVDIALIRGLQPALAELLQCFRLGLVEVLLDRTQHGVKRPHSLLNHVKAVDDLPLIAEDLLDGTKVRLAHSRPSGGPLKHPPSLRDRIVARLIHRYPV